MTTYDPQPPQQPYTPPSTYSVPVDSEPTTDGDRWGLIAITVALMTLLSCVPGLNCLLPFAPLTAGIIALARAKNAANPSRARTYGWIATILGGLVLLGLIIVIGLYGAFVFRLVNEVQTNPDFRTAP